jgi:hypothetical protein
MMQMKVEPDFSWFVNQSNQLEEKLNGIVQYWIVKRKLTLNLMKLW